MRAMDTALYRSPDLADRIEALIASVEADTKRETRMFRFERVDDASVAEGHPMNCA